MPPMWMVGAHLPLVTGSEGLELMENHGPSVSPHGRCVCALHGSEALTHGAKTPRGWLVVVTDDANPLCWLTERLRSLF